MGTITDDPDLSAMAQDAISEVIAVGKAKGIPFPDDAVEQTYKNIGLAPRETMSSMSMDLLRGKKMELPWLSAKVAEFGREVGVPTPTHHFMASILRPFQDGNTD
jgi:2-dehydropantoate 2-reductase